ncbi:hypothetical protein NQ317_002582, partial [Molorchus minor]
MGLGKTNRVPKTAAGLKDLKKLKELAQKRLIFCLLCDYYHQADNMHKVRYRDDEITPGDDIFSMMSLNV